MQPLVLVASPSAYRRGTYADELQRRGFEVGVASGGVDCLEWLRSRPPDVVLLEPALLWGGSEGVLEVRAGHPRFRNIPLVLVAVEGVSTEVYRLARYSIQDFLSRPPTGEELAAALHAAIRRMVRKPKVLERSLSDMSENIKSSEAIQSVMEGDVHCP